MMAVQELLRIAAQDAQVLSAALAVCHRGVCEEIHVGAAPDVIYRLGSVTKLWTAVLVHRLAAEGRIDLDVAIHEQLAEFMLADADAARVVTPRQVLQHRGGFFGDVYTDMGSNDDAIERYVAALRNAPQLFSPGKMHSYSNSGYVVLGRLVEATRGQPYDRLFDALAAQQGWNSIDVRASAGQPGPRCLAPAGATAGSCARDLASFAAALLPKGPLAAEAAAMASSMIPGPCATFAVAWGSGLMAFDEERRTLGHDGFVLGGSAYLRFVPEADLAVVLLVNRGDGRALAEALLPAILFDRCGIRVAVAPPIPEATDFDTAPYVGQFGAGAYRLDVAAGEGSLTVSMTLTAESDAERPITAQLYRQDSELFVTELPSSRLPSLQRFVDRDRHGRYQFLNFRGRVFPRLQESVG